MFLIIIGFFMIRPPYYSMKKETDDPGDQWIMRLFRKLNDELKVHDGILNGPLSVHLCKF